MFSNKRKKILSGWLSSNAPYEYNNSLKLQKFLFFYEIMSHLNGEDADFASLQGWKNGPVFSSVWGDRYYNRTAFDEEILNEYKKHGHDINEELAKKSAFLAKIMSPNLLSRFTHELDIWKCNEHRIVVLEEPKVPLSIKDLSNSDIEKFQFLFDLYEPNEIDNTEVFTYKDCSFIFSKNDYALLTEDHFQTLKELVDLDSVDTISYVELNEEGVMLID